MEGWDMEKANYKRGGLFMLPFITLALIIAFLFKAPWIALGCIAFFGYGTSIILISVGDKSQ
jgi:hypothetical protein